MLKRKFFYWLTISNFLYIIVLLILAGVAISLTIGQNGIFNRAQTAANTWRNSETNESHAFNGFYSEYDSVYDRYAPDDTNPDNP